MSLIRKIFAVISPFGYTTSLERMIEGVVYRFGEIELTVTLYVLGFKDFDMILGVDWLSQHRSMNDFQRGRVKLNMPRGRDISCMGPKEVVFVLYRKSCTCGSYYDKFSHIGIEKWCD